MRSTAELAGLSPGWWEATDRPTPARWHDFPHLGAPWDHDCVRLRSRRLRVSVVVACWNSETSVGWCLTALRLSSLARLAPERLEVVVCDDGSTDSSWEVVAETLRGLDGRAVRIAHAGKSAALAAAVAASTGDVVVVCDSDMVPGCGALDELAARHEHWPQAVCFGFRSDLDGAGMGAGIGTAGEDTVWRLAHTEAFSRDYRIHIDLPAVERNMMLGTRWLTRLGGNRVWRDARGGSWPRHRALLGCLCSLPRRLLLDIGGFPQDIRSWGYEDSVVAARVEAKGAFLLPVTSAWGHHLVHPLRHPRQWLHGARNELAYEWLLSRPLPTGSAPASPAALDVHRYTPVAGPARDAQGVEAGPAVLAGLGRWLDCLESLPPDGSPDLRAQCLHHLGDPGAILASDATRHTAWGVVALARAGRLGEARAVFWAASEVDARCGYAAEGSAAELYRLADEYAAIGAENQASACRVLGDVRGP